MSQQEHDPPRWSDRPRVVLEDRALENVLALAGVDVGKDVYVVRKQDGKLSTQSTYENALAFAAMSCTIGREGHIARAEIELYRRSGEYVFMKIRSFTLTVCESPRW